MQAGLASSFVTGLKMVLDDDATSTLPGPYQGYPPSSSFPCLLRPDPIQRPGLTQIACLWTRLVPNSSKSSLVIHLSPKLEWEAKMAPPIHVVMSRLSWAMTVRSKPPWSISCWSRSGKPRSLVLPPAKRSVGSTLSRNAGSHLREKVIDKYYKINGFQR